MDGGLTIPLTSTLKVWAPMLLALRFKDERIRLPLPEARAQIGEVVMLEPETVAQLGEIQV